MKPTRLIGATAAATLPAALAAAVLVSAPFAGTTTAPLAEVHHVAYAKPRVAGAEQRLSVPPSRGASTPTFDVPTSAVAALAGFELCLVGVAVGVTITARRRATGG